MPIVLKVKTELDGGGLDDVRRTAQTAFDGMGRDLGAVLETGIKQALSGALSGAVSEFGAFGKVAESALSGIISSSGATALAIGGIGLAVAGATKELYDLGAKWDDIGDSITGATGKIGPEVDAMVASIQQVYENSTLSAEAITKFGEGAMTSLHLSGGAAKEMVQALSDIQEVTGQIVETRDLGKSFRMFDIKDVQAEKDMLDDLRGASQATQIPINNLVDSMLKMGPAAKQAGLDAQDTLGVILAMNEAGLDANQFGQAMATAMRRWATEGKDANTTLDETIAQMKRLVDAGKDQEAMALATANFGRAADKMFEAVKNGTLDVEALHQGLTKLGDTAPIDAQKKGIQDWNQELTKLGHSMETGLAPIAAGVFSSINWQLKGLIENTRQLGQFLADPLGAVGSLFTDPAGPPFAPGSLGGNPGAQAARRGGLSGSAGDIPLGSIGGTTGRDWDIDKFPGGFYSLPKASGGSGGGSGDLTPYGPGYGQGPNPGETAEQYRARMSQLEADHRVAEAEANLDKLRTGGSATAEQLQKAENDLAAARTAQNETILRNREQANKPGSIDVAIPYAPDFGNGPQPGETSQQFSARTALLEAQHRSAEEYAKLRQMESSGVATQNDIINQKNKVLEAQRAQQAAEMRLNDAYSKQVEDATKGMDALGAGLDKDLGLSKGLAGLADNLVRFLGNLAAAPLMGQLNAISAAQGGPGATGSGLIAMAAAGGAFGSDYVVGGYDQSGKPVSVTQMQAAGSTSSPQYFSSPAAAQQSQQSQASALQQQRTPYGLPAGANSGGYGGSGVDFPPWVDQIASAFGLQPSTYAGHQSGNRNEPGYAPNPQGLNRGIDWSGPVPNMQAFADYLAANPQYVEQAIWQNPNTGRREGIAGGRDVTNTGYYADDYAAHGNHVHTRQSMSIPLPGDMNYGGQPQLHDAGLLGSSAGAIPPGTTVVQNNTGANEHIATPAQLGDIMGAGWGPGGRPPSPGVGNDGMGASSGKGDGPTQIGGSEPKSQNGASAGGGGGLFGAAVGAGSMAADAFAPGSGAAVQIAGQEIQRAIKAGGQFAGIVAGGLMETFLPAGASQIANDNWITRVGGAFAGLAPQLPNMAGKAPTPVPNKAPGQPAMPVFPGAPGTDKPKDGASPTFNVTLNANGPIEDKHVDQMTGALQRQYETGMAQVGGR